MPSFPTRHICLSEEIVSHPATTRPTPCPANAVGVARETEHAIAAAKMPRLRMVAIISCLTCITGIGNLLAGLLTLCIPTIASDLGIPQSLQLWPAAAFALACGVTLLPLGAVTDVVGSRRMCLAGAVLQTASAVGSGLARNTSELIALRTVAGVAASFCLPGAVGVAGRVFDARDNPRWRSAAFAAMGGGQAIGFGVGLVLGGVCTQTIGWRWGFYITAITNGVVLVAAFWALPRTVEHRSANQSILSRLGREIDWLGALLLSTSLALLSYVLSITAASNASRNLRRPLNIALLVLGTLLLVASGLWMKRQTKRNRLALVPSTVWSNIPFTAVCVTVFLAWGSLNASEQLTALYLQDILGRSPLQTSLYFLPAPITGLLVNMAIGFLLPYLRPSITVPAGCLVSGTAPLLLAVLCRVDGPGYWSGVFEAVALNPLGADIIYTIANLIVTDAFPPSTQALAGGIFNTLAQIGKSVGIATTSALAGHITAQGASIDSKTALLHGYKAGWFYNLALGFAAATVSFYGLKNTGKLGVKRE
ncbi:major facilitator superfamily domain-containing protein [Xylaria scruposa]|nr:major facilitator superfamily domain-containing protein [Xylaria scruposa]